MIGGGPTGLGIAIEARQLGIEVILVEKRSSYTRQNVLFLYPSSLALFDAWGVSVPMMERPEYKGEERGLVLIHYLEEALRERAEILGVEVVEGEYIDFIEDAPIALIQTEAGKKRVFYDLLIGADGTHSKVREQLQIDNLLLGEAMGIISDIPKENLDKEVTVENLIHDDAFAKRVFVPHSTLVFMQTVPKKMTLDFALVKMIQIASELGWNEEVAKMMQGELSLIENVPIYLQRSSTFSDPKKKAIIIGDAAASASFYQGTGANFSLKTTQIAKELLESDLDLASFEKFNQMMSKEVDWLIDISLPLFQ